jgi:hypothetical protein
MGSPSAGPAAPGANRSAAKTVPAGDTDGAGPVSGPATNTPWPCSQMRSTQASGSTAATAVAPGPTTRAHRHATDGSRPAGGGCSR